MKNLAITFCQAFWGAFLLLTSLYCLLAFLPYTYVALIKAPPYAWVLWFIAHYAALYWAALLAGVIGFWRRRRLVSLGFFLAQAMWGFFVPHFMRNLPCDGRAYASSLGALFLVVGVAAADGLKWRESSRPALSNLQLNYRSATLVAAGVALLSVGVAEWNSPGARPFSLNLGGLELTAWSVISHLLVAVLVLSLLNLFSLAAARTARPRAVRRGFIGVLIFGGLWFGAVRFLESSLTFEGWRAQVYAALLAAALTLLGFSLARPYIASTTETERSRRLQQFGWIAFAAALVIVAIALPSLIAGGDWNGFLQSTFAMVFWLGLSVCSYQLWPGSGKYSLVTLLAVALLSVFSYKALQTTEIFWGKALGHTDDDIARALDAYAAHDASFQLAHALLGNAHQEDCGDLCRILREYTNIRDAKVPRDVTLLDSLVPTHAARPDIFIFVVDSLRPDYLGAYNPKVDFSPNLDAFARDSVVMHNVYTQYAGTSLSEPAIWAGMMLLHAHYMQPFSRVNSLEKLANVDGYRMIVSWDEVVRQLLSPSDDLTKLDTDKPLWNELEVCSTIQQTEPALNAGSRKPVFFYAQPKNVHQFAHNNLPRMTAQNWQSRPGFVDRIAYEVHQVDGCMGSFFQYLKQKNLYDDSIIIVTSDHGDATGEFGRYSHSLSIYPEVIRVPLMVHLPKQMRDTLVYDDSRISALTDIAPSLYELLGHGPVLENPMFGRPLFMPSLAELHQYQRDELFIASDERAVYGILADHGRYLYATYDSPSKSYLYDLASDPNGVHDILTPALKKQYDERIIRHLQAIGAFYDYKPGLSTLLSASAN